MPATHHDGDGQKPTELARSLFLLLLIIALVGCSGRLSTFEAGVAGDGKLDVALEHIREQHELPALAAVLIKNGEIVETGAVGIRSAGSTEPVTMSDRWHLGSIGKSMTATLAAVLVEKGVIDWDTTIGEVFPDLTESTRPEYVDVRLVELLSHTAGFPKDETHVPSFSSFRGSTEPTREHRRQWAAEILARVPESPRGEHSYSNTNYLVAGAMLEELTGELWENLMQRALFEPLGMMSTGFGAPGTVGEVPDEPRGHARRKGEWVAYQPVATADNAPALGPAGTAHTTLADFACYMAAHLAGARGEGGLVTAETFEQLHAPAPGTSYALGWSVGEKRWAGGRTFQHFGSNQIWYANMWIAPERDFAMLTVTNAGGEAAREGTDDAIRALIDRFDAAEEGRD